MFRRRVRVVACIGGAMSRRRFAGYFVVREYGHHGQVVYTPLFVASYRRAAMLAEWYRDDAERRYVGAFYAYVVPANELETKEEFHGYHYDPRHEPIAFFRGRTKRLHPGF